MPYIRPMHEQYLLISDYFKTQRRVLITTHFNPDGDAIGSSIGLACALRSLGHSVKIVLPNAVSSNLQYFLAEESWFIAEENQEELYEELKDAEVLATLDFNHLSRSGEIIQKALSSLEEMPFIWMIDHHMEPSNYAKWTLSDTKKSSTCEMVWDLLSALKWESHLSPLAANALYAGIMTDTGSFRFPSTSAQTHRAVAGLIDCGAEPHTVHEGIFDQNRIERLHLLSASLSHLTILNSGETLAFYLTLEEQQRIGLAKGDTEGFVNYGLSVTGVQLSVFFIEAENFWKLSLRSKENLDVNLMARALFQGGGHKNAAGGRYEGDVLNAMASIEKYIHENA